MAVTSQAKLPLPELAEDARDSAEKSDVERTTALVYRLVDDGLGSIGGIVGAAGVCGKDRGDLRKAIDRAGYNRLHVDSVIAIHARLSRYNATLAAKLGSALVYAGGLEVFPRVTMTDAERAARLEAKLRSLPYGEQMIDDALGGKR